MMDSMNVDIESELFVELLQAFKKGRFNCFAGNMSEKVSERCGTQLTAVGKSVKLNSSFL